MTRGSFDISSVVFAPVADHIGFGHLQGSKKGRAGSDSKMHWDAERETVLQVLIQLLQLDIRSLWSLSLVEEEFVRSVSRSHLFFFEEGGGRYISLSCK